MGILKSTKKITLEDRDINLFLDLSSDNQMGHVLIHPREQMSENYLSHDEDEFLYLIKGNLSVKTRTDEWKIVAGQMNLIPKGTEHIVENLGDDEGEFVFFNIR